MSKAVKVTKEVYVCIGLHAAKYPQGTVLGYLVGTEDNNQVSVTDMLPIAHNAPAGPILELAGQVADKVFPTPKKVLGLYYASADNQTPYFLKQVSQELKRINGDCVSVKLNQELLSAPTSTLFLEATALNGNKLKLECLDTAVHANETLNRLLEQHQETIFVDFEDHMNHGGKDDFRNTTILSAVRSS